MKSLNSKIFAYNCYHNASVCYLKDGNIEFHLEEERVSRYKFDHRPYMAIADSLKRVDGIDYVLHTTLPTEKESKKVLDFTYELTRKLDRYTDRKAIDFSNEHHLFHAALGFYNSGFEDAVCISVDGGGALLDTGKVEVETIYKASYPCNFEKVYQKDRLGIGFVYAGVSEYLGFGTLECGKTMGLAAYGKDDPNIKPFVVDGKIDETLWERDPNGFKFKPYDNINHENLAWRVQKDFETYMIGLINKALEVSNNIVISGGCALNCVANYEYLKHLPEGAKLYVEPVSTDAGTSIGMAMIIWRQLSKSMDINPIKTLYLGPEHEILL